MNLVTSSGWVPSVTFWMSTLYSVSGSRAVSLNEQPFTAYLFQQEAFAGKFQRTTRSLPFLRVRVQAIPKSAEVDLKSVTDQRTIASAAVMSVILTTGGFLSSASVGSTRPLPGLMCAISPVMSSITHCHSV